MVITQKHTPGLPADDRDLSGCALKPTIIALVVANRADEHQYGDASIGNEVRVAHRLGAMM